MSIGLKTQKILWGKAAGHCAFPECRRRLVEDISETDDPTVVGENCHIVAEKDDGPRGDKNMPVDERNRYANLILLCNVDHKIIDDNVTTWTVEKLHALKQEHEAWVESALSLDKKRASDDVIYADYVDEWARLGHIANWKGWSSYVLAGGRPSISVTVDKDLDTLRSWLINRIWPRRYQKLESAFANFQRVLVDFHETLRSHLDPVARGGLLTTEKFYQIPNWDQDLYADLSAKYDFHVDLVHDLTMELTRAANLICDQIRVYLSHSYRRAEGHLSLVRGPDTDFMLHEFVPCYSAKELEAGPPYTTLNLFYDARRKRDRHVGGGNPPP